MCMNEQKKEEQKDNAVDKDRIYPVEQVPDIGDPTLQQVNAAVKELNPDPDSLESRG